MTTQRQKEWLAAMLLAVLLMVGAVGLLMLAFDARAATSQELTVTVQLKRGSSLVTLVPAPTTLVECEQRRDGLIAIDAQTKFSGTSTYSCIETRRSVVTFTPNAPPPPVDCVVSEWGAWVLGTPSACTAGQQSRVDTRTRTVTMQPSNGGAACPALSETRTETLTCEVAPPPPTAPANLTGTIAANTTTPANSNVTLTWTAVAGVTIYEVYRCTGASCTNWAFLADAPAATYTNSNLPPGLTYRYRVRAWKPTTGPYSAIFTIATTATPPPPPPAGTGTASLQWTHDGKNTDGTAATLAGFRVLYGTSATALTNTVQVPAPPARTFVVDKLAVGTWFFAVRAYDTAGAESVSSNVASKVVQ